MTETSLRNLVGGRDVMRDQLRYLAEVAERPNVTLRVVPALAGVHPGLDGPFLRLRFDDRAGVVYLGHLTSSLFIEDRSEVAVYDRAITQLLAMAISEENSVRLVVEMAASLG